MSNVCLLSGTHRIESEPYGSGDYAVFLTDITTDYLRVYDVWDLKDEIFRKPFRPGLKPLNQCRHTEIKTTVCLNGKKLLNAEKVWVSDKGDLMAYSKGGIVYINFLTSGQVSWSDPAGPTSAGGTSTIMWEKIASPSTEFGLSRVLFGYQPANETFVDTVLVGITAYWSDFNKVAKIGTTPHIERRYGSWEDAGRVYQNWKVFPVDEDLCNWFYPELIPQTHRPTLGTAVSDQMIHGETLVSTFDEEYTSQLDVMADCITGLISQVEFPTVGDVEQHLFFDALDGWSPDATNLFEAMADVRELPSTVVSTLQTLDDLPFIRQGKVALRTLAGLYLLYKYVIQPTPETVEICSSLYKAIAEYENLSGQHITKRGPFNKAWGSDLNVRDGKAHVDTYPLDKSRAPTQPVWHGWQQVMIKLTTTYPALNPEDALDAMLDEIPLRAGNIYGLNQQRTVFTDIDRVRATLALNRVPFTSLWSTVNSAWEVSPLSFAADWISPVGAILGHLDKRETLKMLPISHVCRTIKADCDFTEMATSIVTDLVQLYGWLDENPSVTAQSRFYRRYYSKELPKLNYFPETWAPVSFSGIWDQASALLTQQDPMGVVTDLGSAVFGILSGRRLRRRQRNAKPHKQPKPQKVSPRRRRTRSVSRERMLNIMEDYRHDYNALGCPGNYHDFVARCMNRDGLEWVTLPNGKPIITQTSYSTSKNQKGA